ncbi:MAG: sulfatase-like hydrolase/transferase [Thermotogae bacterium]|nr:sulfatase-like hydrolase/transferase [Thermotogota bacterium]
MDIFPVQKSGCTSILQVFGYKSVGITTNVVTSRAYGYEQGFNYFEDFMNLSKKRQAQIKARRSKWKGGNNLFGKIVRKGRSFLWNMYLKLRKISDQSGNYDVLEKIQGEQILEKLSGLFKSVSDIKSSTFFFLHFIEPHAPYYAPEEILEEFITDKKLTISELSEIFKIAYNTPQKIIENQELLELTWRLYLASVEHFDHIVGDFLNILDQQGILNNSIIILMADHGEAFGEHRYIQHPMDRHNVEQIKIPLIITGPGIERGFSNKLVQQIDILPTIMDLIGLKEIDKRLFLGKSMLGEEENHYVLTIGNNNTWSFTTKKKRIIQDQEGMKVYSTSDSHESKHKGITDMEILNEIAKMRMKMSLKVRSILERNKKISTSG